MKRAILITLAALMVLGALSACGGMVPPTVVMAKPTEAATPAPTNTPEPTPLPTPSWQEAMVRAGRLGVVWKTLRRGDQVTVTSETFDYYGVTIDGEEFLIEKRFLRREYDSAPEACVGYATADAGIYASPYLEGTPLQVLFLNQEVNVLDVMDSVLYVQCGLITGYARASQISESFIESSYHGGGGGGSKQPSGGDDGGDIHLASERMPRYFVQPLVFGMDILFPVDPYRATVLADGTEVYVGIVERGTPIRVMNVTEESCQVYPENGLIGVLPRWAVTIEGDPEYETWKGYCSPGTPMYADCRLTGEPAELMPMNVECIILDEINGAYVVSVGDCLYYTPTSSISKLPFITGSGRSESAPEWTDPLL